MKMLRIKAIVVSPHVVVKVGRVMAAEDAVGDGHRFLLLVPLVGVDLLDLHVLVVLLLLHGLNGLDDHILIIVCTQSLY